MSEKTETTPTPFVVGVDVAQPGTDQACASIWRREAGGTLTLLALRPRAVWVEVCQP